jgi:hypothetical protein
MGTVVVNDDDAPHEYLCPITLEIMMDPVMAEDGHTYERSAIEDWFNRGNATSPKTQATMGSRLLPNHTLKALLVSFKCSPRSSPSGDDAGIDNTGVGSPSSGSSRGGSDGGGSGGGASSGGGSAAAVDITIGEWLENIKPCLRVYEHAFNAYGFEDTDMLTDATEADLEEALEEVEVKSFHRKLITKAFLQERRYR